MEEVKRVQGSRFDEFSRRSLIENQDTILAFTARIQELQNEVNCTNDLRDFKMLNQYAVDYPTFPVNQAAGDPRGLQETGAKGENVEEIVEMVKRLGKEALSRIFSVKANGMEVTSA